jgi:acetyltransferase-like isoleucine patch superfamily enzyme
MTENTSRDLLREEQFIRDKLMTGDKSSIRRYADLVVGEGASYGQLLKYELITELFGGLPGALGLALRQLIYPRLFKRAGKGVVFGRHVVIRNAQNLSLGDGVIIDDGCVLDGRGSGSEGVVIGDRVIVSRGTTIQAKIGPIQIGDDCDIGAGSTVHSQGGIAIGRAVVIGGGTKISGGAFQTDRRAAATDDPSTDGAHVGMLAREQTRWTSGPIRIGDKCLIGMGTIVLDGVEIGEGSVIGAGTVMTKSVPAYSVVAGVPGRVLRMREIGYQGSRPRSGGTRASATIAGRPS